MSAVVLSLSPVTGTPTAGDTLTQKTREPEQIAGALQRAREAIHLTGRSAVHNIWAAPREYAPGAKNRTLYK